MDLKLRSTWISTYIPKTSACSSETHTRRGRTVITTDYSNLDPDGKLVDYESWLQRPQAPAVPHAQQPIYPGTTPDPSPPGSPEPPSPRRRGVFLRWAKRIAVTSFALFLLVESIAVGLIFFMPPSTMFMATDEASGPTVQQNVSIDHISRYIISAVIVHEDGELGTRLAPFDYGEFVDRIAARLDGEKDPAGSSIPQQVTKNIFFNRSQNSVKKGIEALFALPFGYTISDERMMEIYLNIAQFGPNLYGVCAATWYYFDVPPWNVSSVQAAQLAGLLPLGEDVRRAHDGGIDLSEDAFWLVPVSVNRAAGWFIPQIESEMGGWEGVAATIGIAEPASAFEDTLDQPDACSTMPQAVRDRLDSEGVAPN
ncbi:monofunctional biosynthetic peptidoglycan transglycosylase [Rhodococcus sp. 27YEA15]|uniref:transglycosylase domain-containing protein n=1 Tax=Rhodococcus sp. 27YEA15 TaxID=3156259 RepID=UPI003C7D72C0